MARQMNVSQTRWIYFMHPSGQERVIKRGLERGSQIFKNTWKVIEQTLCLSHLKPASQIFLLPVEPVGNSTRLPITPRGGGGTAMSPGVQLNSGQSPSQVKRKYIFHQGKPLVHFFVFGFFDAKILSSPD